MNVIGPFSPDLISRAMPITLTHGGGPVVAALGELTTGDSSQEKTPRRRGGRP